MKHKSPIKKSSKKKTDKKTNLKKLVKSSKKIPIPVKEKPVIKEKPSKINLEPVVEDKIPEPVNQVEPAEITVVEEKIPEHVPLVKQKISKPLEKPDDTDDRNKIEALLFANGKYMDESILAELCGIDKRRVKKILEQLREYYANKDSALAIFQEENSWKINVREKYLSLVRKIIADTELSRSVMETLAVIAWKTPIFQAEVVRIRGNKCYDHIEELENSGFITKEKKGRSYVIKTTDKFFTYFEIDHGNLKSVFESVKVPIMGEQKTLEEVKISDTSDMVKNIEQIEIKKWSETGEERDNQKRFLEEIDTKIKGAQEKNVLLEKEIPSLRIKSPVAASTETISAEEKSVESEPQTLEDSVQMNSPDATSLDAPAEHKPKSLTKKQLEKKFKDELLRVREKMEKK